MLMADHVMLIGDHFLAMPLVQMVQYPHPMGYQQSEVAADLLRRVYNLNLPFADSVMDAATQLCGGGVSP